MNKKILALTISLLSFSPIMASAHPGFGGGPGGFHGGGFGGGFHGGGFRGGHHGGFGRGFAGGLLGGMVGGAIMNGGFGWRGYGYPYPSYGYAYPSYGYVAPPPPPPTYLTNCSYDIYGNQICTRVPAVTVSPYGYGY